MRMEDTVPPWRRNRTSENWWRMNKSAELGLGKLTTRPEECSLERIDTIVLLWIR